MLKDVGDARMDAIIEILIHFFNYLFIGSTIQGDDSNFLNILNFIKSGHFFLLLPIISLKKSTFWASKSRLKSSLIYLE